ncbi:MAG: phosphodiester glycosidase family protein [Bacilli bacterium]|nr:phosphodiester glycosidase family protein [Bacilli bacterium]
MNKKKLKKTTILFIVLDVLAIICLFITYGPIHFFKDTLITTAMTTMNHQYLARTFYNNKTIEEVLKENTIKDSGLDSDSSHIIFNSNTEVINNKYDEEILTKKDNEIYKIIPISGNGFKGELIAIYDPKMIHLVSAKTIGVTGETLDIISKDNNAIVGINASGFEDNAGVGNGGEVSGILIMNKEIISNIPNTAHGGGIIGFDENGVLMLSHKTAYEAIQDGMIDGVQFGPFLIVNGEVVEIVGNGGMGIQPRTAIAQRQDGIVLFLIIDGRQPGYSIGATIADVTDILKNYGAYNAANLDGGASTTLTINSEIYNKPCGLLNGNFAARGLPNAWLVY